MNEPSEDTKDVPLIDLPHKSPYSIYGMNAKSSNHEGLYPNSNPFSSSIGDDSPTKPGWQTWTCTILCVLNIILLGIIGVLLTVPYTGLFAAVSLIPGLFILWLIYWRKHRNEAYLSRVVVYIAAGMIGILPIAIVEYGINYGFLNLETKIQTKIDNQVITDVFLSSFVSAFIVAALCEEVFKYMIAYSIPIRRGKEVPYSVVVYTVAGAVGLASLENMMYLIATTLSTRNFIAALFTAITRAFIAVPLHATTGVLIGTEMAKKKFNMDETKSSYSAVRILALPIFLHGLYDFCMMFAASYASYTGSVWIFSLAFISIITVIVGTIIARRRALHLLEFPFSYGPLVQEV